MALSRGVVVFVSGVLITIAACGDDTGASSSGSPPDASTGTDGGSSSGASSSSSGNSSSSSSSSSSSGAPIDGGNDGAAPGYDVKTLPGLVLWLESGTGVDLGGPAVPAKWSDQSGKGNDAVQPAGECGKPDRNANTLNGRLGVGFHEFECLQIADNASLQWGTGDFYVGAVTRNFANTATSADIGTTFKYQDGSYQRKRFGEVYSKIASTFGPGPTIVFNDWTDRSRKIVGSLDLTQMVKTPNIYAEPGHLIALRRKGQVLELRIDGAVTTQMTDAGAPLDISNAGTPVAIGGRPNLTNFVGSIWELVAIKGASTDADLAAFEAHAKAKYQLPGPND
jgi:hypothetical protein